MWGWIPNGILAAGLSRVTIRRKATADITENTGYSGYFRNGSRALIVGRYSTCCRETRRGHIRSLSLVGKLFPTADPDHVAPLRTASFMTQQDIGGDYNDYINDVELLSVRRIKVGARVGSPCMIPKSAKIGTPKPRRNAVVLGAATRRRKPFRRSAAESTARSVSWRNT